MRWGFFSFDMPLVNTPYGHLASELKSTSTGVDIERN